MDNNVLNDAEVERLVELGKVIKKLPNTLRQLSRIQTAMGEYLGIHDINFDMAASHEYKTALSDLATYIKGSLDCNANGTGLPCRTDRLFAVKMMDKMLWFFAYEEISTDPLGITTGGE
tara:strand:+ start:272 stop:628 length:357 start_codon:yes stop_codon:yes gene_type:complete